MSLRAAFVISRPLVPARKLGNAAASASVSGWRRRCCVPAPFLKSSLRLHFTSSARQTPTEAGFKIKSSSLSNCSNSQVRWRLIQPGKRRIRSAMKPRVIIWRRRNCQRYYGSAQTGLAASVPRLTFSPPPKPASRFPSCTPVAERCSNQNSSVWFLLAEFTFTASAQTISTTRVCDCLASGTLRQAHRR